MTLVENLLNLYRVDKQVRGLRGRLDSAQLHLTSQQRQLDQLQLQQQELNTRQRHLKASIANLEVEIKVVDERLEKYRNDLNSSVTNKQYTTVLSELTTVKASRAALEDQMLVDMEQLEDVQKQLTELEGKIAERSRLREHAQGQLDERRNDIGQRLAELESERAKAAAVVPEDALTIFDEMANQYDGEAMAPIEEINRRHREYSCGECNMQLPFEHISMLTGRGEALVRCASCNRILFMQEEMRGTLAKK